MIDHGHDGEHHCPCCPPGDRQPHIVLKPHDVGLPSQVIIEGPGIEAASRNVSTGFDGRAMEQVTHTVAEQETGSRVWNHLHGAVETERLRPKRYRREAEAVQWDGTAKHATVIIDWLLAHGITATYYCTTDLCAGSGTEHAIKVSTGTGPDWYAWPSGGWWFWIEDGKFNMSTKFEGWTEE